MKSKIILIIVASMLASLSANAEIITLSNGDRISGKVSQANDAQIVLTTQFGDITIPRESITAISADANSPTVSQTVADAPAPASAETASAPASDSTQPPEEKEPQWIVDYRQFIKDNFPETWQFRFRGGVENRETTSSVFSAYFALDAKREWDLNKFSATAYYNYTNETSVGGVKSTTLDKYGIRLMSWYPLGHGDRSLMNEPVFAKLAEKYGKSPAQVILRWHTQMGFAVIPGSKNVDHIRDNLNILDFSLTDEEMAEIAKLDQGVRYYHRSDDQLAHFASWRPEFETE
jgi:hypothetical protein